MTNLHQISIIIQNLLKQACPKEKCRYQLPTSVVRPYNLARIAPRDQVLGATSVRECTPSSVHQRERKHSERNFFSAWNVFRERAWITSFLRQP